jgi:hypothetical protein
MIFEKTMWGAGSKLLVRLEMRKAISVNALKKSCARELDSSPFFGIFPNFLGGFEENQFS